MTPFRLHCPSCQSRILVRHAYLVGQRLPCPKCKELLEVIVPEKESGKEQIFGATPVNAPDAPPIQPAPKTSRPIPPVSSDGSTQSPLTVAPPKLPENTGQPQRTDSSDPPRHIQKGMKADRPQLKPETANPGNSAPPTSTKHLDSAALTKDDYGDWEAVLANIPANFDGDQLENIAWDQVATDQANVDPLLAPPAEPTAAPPEAPPAAPPSATATRSANAIGGATGSEVKSHSTKSKGTASGSSTEGLSSDLNSESFSLDGLPSNLPAAFEGIPEETTFVGSDYIPLPNGTAPPSGKQSSAPKQPNPNDATSKLVSRRKQYVLVGSIALASSVAAGLGFWGFLNLISKPKQTASNQVIVAPPLETTSVEDGGEGTTSGSPVGSEASSEFDVEASLNSVDLDSADESGTDEPDTDESGTVESGTVNSNPEDVSVEEGELEFLPDILLLPGETSKRINETSVAGDGSTSNTGPSNLGPSNLGPSNTGSAPAPEQTNEPESVLDQVDLASSDGSDEDESVSEKLPDLFGPNGFGQLLTPHMNIGDTQFGGNAPIDELDVEKLEDEGFVLSHPDPQQVPLWQDRAPALAISRIRFQDQSLISCVDLFSKMSGIGITLDWPSIRAVGLNENLKISLDLQGQPLDQVVNAVLAQHNLYLEVPGDGLPIVRPKGGTGENAIKSVWNLDEHFPGTNALDSVSDSGKKQLSLAEQLVELWGVQTYCIASGNELHWEPNASPLAKASIWTTLNILQEISGGTALNWDEQTPEPKLLFHPEDWHQSQSVLERTVGENIHLPELRPVSDILSIAAKELDVELLIDWRNVWQHGLVPTQTEISVLRNRTLAQVSKRFRDQYSLQIVTVGKEQFMLTTPEARKTNYVVVPIRLPEGVALDELKRSLLLLAPANAEGRTMFRVVQVAGRPDVYLARIMLPSLEQLDDDELHVAFGWKRAAANEVSE